MTTKQETIRLLTQLNEALDEIKRIWDGVEAWAEENLEPAQKEAA